MEKRPSAQRRAPSPFTVKLFLFFSLRQQHVLFISAITAQTDSSLAQPSSPIASISTSNLISPKERTADEQSREAEREKTSYHINLCRFGIAIVRVCVSLYGCIFPFFSLLSSLFPSLFFFQRKKAFKGAIVQSGWSGLLVSGQQNNTTNMDGTNQGPG